MIKVTERLSAACGVSFPTLIENENRNLPIRMLRHRKRTGELRTKFVMNYRIATNRNTFNRVHLMQGEF